MPVKNVTDPNTQQTYQIEFPDNLPQEQYRTFAAKEIDRMKAEQTDPGFLRREGQAMAQGATFGFADEMRGVFGAGLEALGGDFDLSENYRDYRDIARDEYNQYQEEAPLESAGYEVSGGLITGVPGAIKASGTRAVKALSNVPAWLKTLGAGTIAGGVAGTGYSEGETVGEIAGDTAKGTVIGAGTGAAIPAVATLGRKAGQLIGKAGQSMAPEQRRAMLKIEEAMMRDGMTPEQLAARLRKAGPEATIADVGGENLKGLGEIVAQNPGQQRNMILNMVEQRQRGQQGRIMEGLRNYLGDEKDFYETLENVRVEKLRKAAPLYEEAFSVQIPYTEKLKSLAERPYMQEAIKRAMNKARNEGDRLPEIMRVADDGSVEILDAPNMKVWDYVKRSMDDLIENARRNSPADARAMINLKNELLGEIDQLNPTYAQARGIYAQGATMQDALEQGRKFINQDAEITQKALEDLSELDREFFRAGAIRAIRDKIEMAPDTADAYKRIFNKPAMRKKLRALFNSDKEFARFARTMLNESQFAQTRQQVMGGSPTLRRQALQQDLRVMPENVAEMAGNPAYALARGTQRAMSDRLGLPEGVMQQVGGAMYSQDPVTQQALIQQLRNRATRQNTPAQLNQFRPGQSAISAVLSGQAVQNYD